MGNNLIGVYSEHVYLHAIATFTPFVCWFSNNLKNCLYNWMHYYIWDVGVLLILRWLRSRLITTTLWLDIFVFRLQMTTRLTFLILHSGVIFVNFNFLHKLLITTKSCFYNYWVLPPVLCERRCRCFVTDLTLFIPYCCDSTDIKLESSHSSHSRSELSSCDRKLWSMTVTLRNWATQFQDEPTYQISRSQITYYLPDRRWWEVMFSPASVCR